MPESPLPLLRSFYERDSRSVNLQHYHHNRHPCRLVLMERGSTWGQRVNWPWSRSAQSVGRSESSLFISVMYIFMLIIIFTTYSCDDQNDQNHGQVIIFDVQTCPALISQGGLKQLLESEHIIKVIIVIIIIIQSSSSSKDQFLASVNLWHSFVRTLGQQVK